MSRRREVQSKLRQLGEIGDIMRSIKNLALMETRKLGRYAEAQRRGIKLVETVAAEFLAHFPQPTEYSTESASAVLVIGSERGFCGEFNEQLWQQLTATAPPRLLIAVGGKLCDRLKDRGYDPIPLAGAMVAEDLPDVINRVALTLADLQQKHPRLSLQTLAHENSYAGPIRKSLLPPFQYVELAAPYSQLPPMLYLTPSQFYVQLVDHYLAAVLAEIFHASLLAENEHRIRHLEGAVQRLEEKTDEMNRRSQVLRQEEITEEIEIILLSAEGMSGS